MSAKPLAREVGRGPDGDLGLRLTLFGAAAILAGAGSWLLALLHVVLPVLAPEVDVPSAAAGVALYALIGLVLVASGVGSVLRRRWVRPVMLLVSGTWLIVGVVVSWLILRLAPDVLLAAGLDPADPSARVVRAVLVGGAATVLVLLPAAFFWAYRDPRVRSTCERHDARRGRSERCPEEVLALSGALALSALSSLPLVLRPAIPLFGHLVTGWPGRLVVLAGIATCGWLAWSTYRLRPAGYWVTLALLVGLGVSTSWTFARVDPLELYRSVGYSEDLLARMPSIGEASRAAIQLASVVLTIAGVAWMLSLRRHFT